MKIKLHPNQWTITVTDFDFNQATQDDIDIFGCLTNYYTLVVVKNQKLEVPTEEKICKMFGYTLDEVADDLSPSQESRKRFTVPGSNIVVRVTAEKNEHGDPGLFPFTRELVWHANKPQSASRRSMVWLYGARGTEGSVTGFTNHIHAYRDLPQDVKDEIKDLQAVYEYEYSKDEAFVFNTTEAKSLHTPPVVYTNIAGQTGIFLCWNQLSHFVGKTKEESRVITDKLVKHILGNPDYVYDHQWEDGDVLLMEQWLGVHRRHAFEKMETRLLHRIETEFSKIDFSKMDRALSMVEH